MRIWIRSWILRSHHAEHINQYFRKYFLDWGFSELFLFNWSCLSREFFSPNWLCQHFLHCNNYSSSHLLQAFSITFHLVLNVIDIQLYRSHIFLLFFFYLLSFPILDKHGPCSSLQFSFEFLNQTWIRSLVLWCKKLVMFPNKICICYSL